LCLLAGWTLGNASGAQCQELADQILTSFPVETNRIEYIRPAELRKLPNYAEIRGQFLGARLSAMDAALSTLGISEGDIDEAALGWTIRKPHAQSDPTETREAGNTATGGPEDGIERMPTELYGFMTGRFDPASIAKSAWQNGAVSIRIRDVDAHCLGRKASGACLAVLSESLAAFGEPEALDRLLETRVGMRESLAGDRRFTRLVNEINKNAPVWGMATDKTVSEWFRGWMPGQGETQIDWTKAFDSVETFTYGIEVREKLNLTAKLTGKSNEDAKRLHQLFSAVRTLLTYIWQTRLPGQPCPLAGLEVKTDGRACVLELAGNLNDMMAYLNSPLRPPAPAPPTAEPLGLPPVR